MMRHYARPLRPTLTALRMLVAVTGAAIAGPFEDATAADERGDYATAYRLLLPLADKGNADAQYDLSLMDGHPPPPSGRVACQMIAATAATAEARAKLEYIDQILPSPGHEADLKEQLQSGQSGREGVLCLNVMIVLDTTASMNNLDPTRPTNCGVTNPTRLDCALAGIQTLLSELWPTQDQVGLMVFPGLNNITSVANDVSCSSPKKVTVVPYHASPIYQIVGFSNDYKTSNTATSLNLSSSSLVMAVCRQNLTTTTSSGATILNCGTCAGLRVVGGEGTYFGPCDHRGPELSHCRQPIGRAERNDRPQ